MHKICADWSESLRGVRDDKSSAMVLLPHPQRRKEHGAAPSIAPSEKIFVKENFGDMVPLPLLSVLSELLNGENPVISQPLHHSHADSLFGHPHTVVCKLLHEHFRTPKVLLHVLILFWPEVVELILELELHEWCWLVLDRPYHLQHILG
jgi:hypothetical protein